MNPLLFLVGLQHTNASYAAAFEPCVVRARVRVPLGRDCWVRTKTNQNLTQFLRWQFICIIITPDHQTECVVGSSILIREAMPTKSYVCTLIFSVETINLSTQHGVLKVVGTAVGVSGALLMALYRGPSLVIGQLGLGLGVGGAAATATIPAAHQWPTSTSMLVATWYLGALCLIGHCFLASAYLVIQVMEISWPYTS